MRITKTVRNFFLLCLGLTASAFAAFSIEPAIIAIQVDRGENSAWIELENTGSGPIAIELIVYERNLDLDGEFIRDSLVRTQDFVVHPARNILSPKGKARVQVVYRGKQKITADRAYMLFSKEVPLKIEQESDGVNIGINTLLNYFTVIAMNTGKPGRLTFVSSKSIGGGKIEVIAENKSSGRVAMDRLAIMVGNQRITDFTGKKNSIMPGQQRRFTFDFERPVTAGEVRFVN